MSVALRDDLRTSTAEGMAASIMVGIGETYLPAFVLALSGSQLACGLVSTVPLVIGSIVQLGLPWIMRKCRSYRRCVSLCAAIQAASFLPLLAAAVLGRMPIALVFGLVAVYWATGLGGSGPWNAWMETLVPSRMRARYFARRTRICQWGIALGFLVGGVALQLANGLGIPLAIFAFLFAVAAASRFTSARLLACQREPQPPKAAAAGTSWKAMIRTLTEGSNGRLLLYLMAAQAAVQISGPYFNPYMLGELQFSYTIYVIVICAAIVAKIAFLPTVGRIADRVGVRRVFWASAAAVIPIPALWLVCNNYGYLIVVQIYSGAVWCAFDLATLLLFFETIPQQKRVDVLSLFNLATSIATAGGSLLGAGILAAWGTNRQAYVIMFLLSSVGRAAAIVLLLRVPARAVIHDLARAIPAPHYLRPSPARPAIGAAKPNAKQVAVGGGSRS